MDDQPSIRLNKVLREFNISTATAVKLLEKYGHVIDYKPTTKITVAQFKILKKRHKEFNEASPFQESLKTKSSKLEITQAKKSIKRDRNTNGIIIKKKPKLLDLITKIEKICLDQPLKKIAVVFGISDTIILKLGKSMIPNCTLDHRVSKVDFEALKPTLELYVKKFIEGLSDEKVVERKKKKKRNYKPSVYNKTSKYYDFVRIIYTNM
jgi:hypothetical protein